MIKNIVIFFASLFIGIGLLIWVIKFIGWQEIESAFLIFSGWQGLIILLLTFLMLFFGLCKWRIILKSQGCNLSHKQLLGPYLAGFSLAYLFPMFIFGGELFKGYLLKEKLSIPWERGISSIIIDRILEATSFLLTIFAGSVFFLLKIGLPPKNLGIILGGFLLAVSFGVGFFYFKVLRKESMVKILAVFFRRKNILGPEALEAEKKIFIFFKNKKVLLKTFLLAFLRVSATLMRCWILLLFLGKGVGFFPVLSILGFYYFAFMIPIPAALGSHELIQTFSFTALGLGAGVAPAFTMIQRGADLILALAGLAVFLKLGLGLLKTILFKKLENMENKISGSYY